MKDQIKSVHSILPLMAISGTVLWSFVSSPPGMLIPAQPALHNQLSTCITTEYPPTPDKNEKILTVR